MSPEQRSAFRQSCGGNFGIDLTDLGGAPVCREDLDRLEYIEDMSLGGQIYDPDASAGHHGSRPVPTFKR